MTDPATADPPRKPVFRTAISVRWGDMDAFEHVNNAQYLRYLEEARVQWLASIGGISLNDRISPVLVASHVNYRRPIEWPEQLVVELFIDKVGNSSLTMAHRMSSSEDADVLYSDGNVVMVWIDTQTGKSVALPDAVRTACIG
ncbi:acyl-CoA thioesterase [Pseudoxanthomonas sacheonensis]|uniref:Acyl-CoA thioester hydrolase n=1 Tax=Pseudoxanthomonas sacheonensis TaxID=443615 RepID=A0ABU1RQP1_9GAMM|nr:thioesterase family protein [Pseudoxanthomonas sacheonensis]MDR6840245.1 acyl-CoA thioester hydrolase [Pseudoxanthomonas sacheonensis]